MRLKRTNVMPTMMRIWIWQEALPRHILTQGGSIKLIVLAIRKPRMVIWHHCLAWPITTRRRKRNWKERAAGSARRVMVIRRMTFMIHYHIEGWKNGSVRIIQEIQIRRNHLILLMELLLKTTIGHSLALEAAIIVLKDAYGLKSNWRRNKKIIHTSRIKSLYLWRWYLAHMKSQA